MFGCSFNNGFAEGDWAEETIETMGFQAVSCTGSHKYTRDAKKYAMTFETILMV